MNSDPRTGRSAVAPRRHRSTYAGLTAHGEPWIWLTAGALATALAMITGLMLFIAIRGAATFWPQPMELITLADGRKALGEVTDRERVELTRDARRESVARRLVRVANYELSGKHFEWFDDADILRSERPEWATAVERFEGGRLQASPIRLSDRGVAVAEGPRETTEAFERLHPGVLRRLATIRRIDRHDRGTVQRGLRAARLAVVQADLDRGADSPSWREAVAQERQVIAAAAEANAAFDRTTSSLREENDRFTVVFATADGQEVTLPLAGVARIWQPNRLTAGGKIRVYLARWWEFLSEDPREANSAGGVFPAIFGTVVMTLIMAVFVAPFGVLAALYLREYASKGPLMTAVRIAINNLAGVPSIVYGAFGLGFFCYLVGGGIDEVFFRPSLVADNQPTFGTGGLLWASLTLALLTLPVVIVATEEALSAVPNSMREGSYACGAGKWQTIRRIVLPRALPGIMTGLILAMARGAGEVAPLMLVGVKKLAVELPVDGSFPFVHPEREFMHLAYLIYDVGFQSPNAEAAKPMVFTITFLLVSIILLLNVAAIGIRSRLRRRYVVQQF